MACNILANGTICKSINKEDNDNVTQIKSLELVEEESINKHNNDQIRNKVFRW